MARSAVEQWSASLQSRRITIVYAASISRSEVNPTRAATLRYWEYARS